MKTKLSVNINKIALLRNSRGTNIPNLSQFALDCQRYGADGITIHPRPDERHITQNDAYELRKLFPNMHCEYNIEGYPSEHFIKMVCAIKPTQVTLVSDAPEALTSSEGWNTIEHATFLKDAIEQFHSNQIRVSLFMDTDKVFLENAKNIGADRIEFYTGKYAIDYVSDKEKAIEQFIVAAQFCDQLGIGINAGHDLNLENLGYFKKCIPQLLEVSIGHALVRDCLYFGLENVIPMYQRLLND